MEKECPSCENKYKRLGSHLSKVSCEYPTLTPNQREIVEGMMLGDGWVNHQSKIENAKPFIAIGMTNHRFLEWLDDELKPHSTGVKDASPSQNSTKPYYKVRTMRNPNLKQFLGWYDNVGSALESFEPTPLSTKMWYVSDGSLHKSGQTPHISICNNYVETYPDLFRQIFKDIGIDPTISGNAIYLTTHQTESFLEYMGPHPPGFERKWCYEFDHHKLGVEVAKEIRKTYECGGVTQAELAEKYGVATPTICKVVNGGTYKSARAEADDSQSELDF